MKADDLLTLHTLGFRGESLPSIASVSHFTLLTREAGAEFATRITLDGGEDMDVESMGGDVGTTITVKDLFYNVPARRKFLRTVNTEGRYISDILSKIALSRPDVHLVLPRDDKEVINTPGSGDLVDTIASLYGKEVTRELLTVDYAQDGITLKGYISRPTLLKGTRQWQTLFVNGRCSNNRMVSKAIDHAYQSQIPKAGFPFAVLHIGIDTVKLGGKHFTYLVNEGDKVKKGQPLIRFELEAIKAEGYPVTTPLIVCNTDDYAAVAAKASGTVKQGDALLELKH